MRIYVASSWRNTTTLDTIIAALRADGHEVYDFRAGDAFDWAECDSSWTRKDSLREPGGIITMLGQGPARRGFKRDMQELVDCDALVLAMPCGRSAHLELGYAIGAGKHTIVYLDAPCEPELMWSAADLVTDQLAAVSSQIAYEVARQ